MFPEMFPEMLNFPEMFPGLHLPVVQNQLTCDGSVVVNVDIPSPFRFIPRPLLEGGSNITMSSMMGLLIVRL
jgi:hypothetical protein